MKLGNNEKILMPIYKELYKGTQNESGVTDKTGVKLTEIVDLNIKGLDPFQESLKFKGRKTPLKYVKQESDWYNSKDLNIKGHVDDVEIWRQVADKDGFVNSNYGWCIFSAENHKQYENSLKALVENKDSRRATMIYTRPSMQYDFNRDGMSDYICTNGTQQLIRDDKLVYIVNQRSCDMIFGLFNDLAWHQEVYQKMFKDLKGTYPELKEGQINMNIGSAHVYERHFGKLEKMTNHNYEE